MKKKILFLFVYLCVSLLSVAQNALCIYPREGVDSLPIAFRVFGRMTYSENSFDITHRGGWLLYTSPYDDVQHISFIEHQPTYTTVFDTICAGETYSWDGMKYTRSGVYPRKYSSVAGCDSVVTLYLTVGETYDIEFADTICQGETYVWNKIKYTKAGSYSQSFTTQHGCDSNVTVHLFVAPIVYESYAESICQDEPYKFGKRILTTPGVYVD